MDNLNIINDKRFDNKVINNYIEKYFDDYGDKYIEYFDFFNLIKNRLNHEYTNHDIENFLNSQAKIVKIVKDFDNNLIDNDEKIIYFNNKNDFNRVASLKLINKELNKLKYEFLDNFNKYIEEIYLFIEKNKYNKNIIDNLKKEKRKKNYKFNGKDDEINDYKKNECILFIYPDLGVNYIQEQLIDNPKHKNMLNNADIKNIESKNVFNINYKAMAINLSELFKISLKIKI